MDILRELKKKIADIDAQTLAMEGRSPTFTVSEIMDLIDSMESAQEISCSVFPNSSDLIDRQSAIDALKPYIVEDEYYDTDENVQGFNDGISCAILELSQLPSAQPEKRTEERTETHACDCISREAAIDEITEYGSGAYMSVAELKRRIEHLPSTQPEPKWILCSERLPENNRQVLVYALSVHFALAKYDEMREADGTYKKQWVTFDAWKPFYKIKDVIAWMPLPDPYTERWKEWAEKKPLRF